MTATDPAAFSALAMYPFPELQAAWDQLYAVIASEVVEVPLALRWDLDVHDTWLSPQLSLGMTCGWPLVTSLRGRVRTVGTFAYEFAEGTSHLYRSVVVAREELPLAQLVTRVAAVNSPESLSGHVSLLAAAGAGATWGSDVVWTGSHVASIDAVRSGAADVASIDALSWEYLRRDRPESLGGLVVVARGPLVPCLPLIVSGAATDEQVAGWRTALVQAVRTPSLAAVRDTLLIRGFVPLEAADYDAALAPLMF